MKFWYGSGSAGSMLLTTGSGFGSGTCIFVIGLQDSNKKIIFCQSFAPYYFLKVHLHHFSKIKSQKEVTKQKESRFFLLFFNFCLIIEGSGTVPLTNGSGLPKNMQIRDPEPQHWWIHSHIKKAR
jgi:hypothetical protein